MKRYPSQIRYEKSHPTISFRLDRELKKRLEKVLEGKSFADFVKEGLGVREREKETFKNAQRKEFWDGFNVGYERAKNEFVVHAPCSICGEPFIVRADEDKIELADFMKSHRWCHASCKEAEDAKRGYRR